MAEPTLTVTMLGRTGLVDLAKATLEGKTVRLPLEWPQDLRGEQPIELRGPGLGRPLRLLVTRAGGRVTKDGVRVRPRLADDVQAPLLEALAAGHAVEADDERPDGGPTIELSMVTIPPALATELDRFTREES